MRLAGRHVERHLRFAVGGQHVIKTNKDYVRDQHSAGELAALS
jgi:hypothetical protein